mmetsp:Transcript_24528/g.28909  ORF Transcript_24528/g.28909 Transcript_24528/m.28909 type:complete len:390 (-) Transcript_24528:361-1530(-)
MNFGPYLGSLSLAVLEGRVVEEVKLVSVKLGVLVEEDSRTALALELDEEDILAIRHAQNFKLDMRLLVDRREVLGTLLTLFRLLVDLLAHLVVDAPVGAGYLVRLALLKHLLQQVAHNVFGRVRGEEAVGHLRIRVELLQTQKHYVTLAALLVRKARVVPPAVDSVAVGAISLILAVLLEGLLAVLLSLRSLLVLLVTLLELGTHLRRRGIVASLDPGVSDDVGDREALVRVEAQHGGNQVLELLVEEAFGLPVGVRRPELARPVRRDQLVVRVVHVCHVEGRVARVHNEQDDAEGEQVHNLGLVGLLGVNLRSHEAERANDTTIDARAIATLHGASETEVHDLHIVELVEKNILALEIAMGETARVDVVDGLDELLGVVAADALAEGT